MSIISLQFAVFVAIALVFYYIIPRSVRWVSLLIFSTVFIVLGSNWQLYALFLGQVLVAYVAARYIATHQTHGFAISGVAVAIEIGLLTLFKGSPLFITTARYGLAFLGLPNNIPFLDWAAPIAMSYYTLMLVSYILDVRCGTIQPEKNFFKVLLFAGFFPQMVTGPLARFQQTGVQLWEGHTFDYENFCFGLQRILWGIFKKLVISERAGIIVTTIYTGGLEGTWTPTGLYIWIGAITYVFQLYTDFSGSIDILIGVAQLFGIRLPENFSTPFYSTSMSELWRRWHMTLGLWLKDYIMFPFLKSRVAAKFRAFCKEKWGKKSSKTLPTYFSMLLVWSYCGFWHGATYKYLFWGLITFVIIVGGLILQPLFDRVSKLLQVNKEAASWTLFGRIRTFLLFAITVSVQPADSLINGLRMWRNAFTYNPWILMDGSLYQLGLDHFNFWIMIFGLAALFFVSHFQQTGSVRALIAKQNLVFRWLLWIGLIMVILLFGMYGEGFNPSDFIYGGF